LCDGKSIWSFAPGKEQADVRPAPPTIDDQIPVINPFLSFFVIRDGDFAEMASRVSGALQDAGTQRIDNTDYRILQTKGRVETVRWAIASDHLVHRISIDARLWGPAPGAGENLLHDQAVISEIRLNQPIDDAIFAAPDINQKKIRDLGKDPDPLATMDKMLKVGTQAPDLDLEIVEGNGQRLQLARQAASHRGMLIYIWNVDCGACYYTLPRLQQLHAQYKNAGLLVAAVQAGFVVEDHGQGRAKIDAEDCAALSALARKYGYTFPMAYDPQTISRKSYDIKSWGRGFLIDPQGRIVWRGRIDVGYRLSQGLQQALDQLGIKPARSAAAPGEKK
jgi:thiol-disulfide isomerase/thioredoxin